MTLSNRILFIVLGGIIAYFSVLGGTAFRAVILDFAPFSFVLLVIAGLGGVVVWGYGLDRIIDDEPEEVALSGSIAVVCGSFLFGVIAQPATATAWISSTWINGWTFLPLIAAVPYIVAVKDICLDVVLGIIQYRRNVKAQKIASEKVLPFKRRDT